MLSKKVAPLLALGVLAVFQNCAVVKFEAVDEAVKEKTLIESGVFQPGVGSPGVGAPGVNATPVPNSSMPVAQVPPAVQTPPAVMPVVRNPAAPAPTMPTTPTVTLPAPTSPTLPYVQNNESIFYTDVRRLPRLCIEKSQVVKVVDEATSPLLDAVGLELKISDLTGAIKCSVTDQMKIYKQVEADKLSFDNCKLEVGKEYVFSLEGSLNGVKRSFIREGGPGAPFAPVRFKFSSPMSNGSTLFKAKINVLSEYFSGNCEDNPIASPLVVDLGADENSENKVIEISSIIDGIMFDILGENSNPAPHVPKGIGWTNNPRYAFLVLPNEDDEVAGINEMFGDNTRGPDGEFAENGFLALAKYDKNKDGVITAKDPIFRKLRLWTDHNYDGLSSHDELKSLNQAKIELIDLNYDGRYREVDQYGNETTFKSVVRKQDGSYNLIFDLWFVYQD